MDENFMDAARKTGVIFLLCVMLFIGAANTAQATTRTLHPLRSPSFSNPIVLQSATILKAGEAYTLAYCAIRGFFGTSCTQSHTPPPNLSRQHL